MDWIQDKPKRMKHEHVHSHDNNQDDHMSVAKRDWKTFLPLILIFLSIGILTVASITLNDSSNAEFGMRMFMGFFFLVFGFFKVINLNGFVQAYGEYDVIAKRSRVYGYVYPLIELALAGAYLWGWNLTITNWVTLVLMLVSSIGVFKKLALREEIPCACLGAVFKIPMTKVTLLEDLLMAVMAVVMLISYS